MADCYLQSHPGYSIDTGGCRLHKAILHQRNPDAIKGPLFDSQIEDLTHTLIGLPYQHDQTVH